MERQSSGDSATANISNGTVRLLRDYTGRGPTGARTFITDQVVTVLLADALTKAERTLVERGNAERVLEVRQAFQNAMRPDLVELVEGQLERKVVAFMSQNHIDPDLAVEVFVLERADAG